MPPIEGEVTVFNKGDVEFQQGTFRFGDGKARFRIDSDNHEVFFQAGQEIVHVFGSNGYEVGHVTLADQNLRTDFGHIDQEGNKVVPFSTYNFTTTVDRELHPGQSVTLEREGVFSLELKNR